MRPSGIRVVFAGLLAGASCLLVWPESAHGGRSRGKAGRAGLRGPSSSHKSRGHCSTGRYTIGRRSRGQCGTRRSRISSVRSRRGVSRLRGPSSRSCGSYGYRGQRYSSVLGRGIHTRYHRYAPSCGTYGYRRGYARPYRPLYWSAPAIYVERVYEQPREEVIEFVPIEEAPPPASSTPAVVTPDAQDFRAQGDAAFREGRYAEARRLHIRALLGEGETAGAQWSYGLAHFALGQYGVAAMAMRRALMAEPNLIDRPTDPRGFYGKQRDFNDQLAALRHHTQRFGLDVEAVFLLGLLEYAVGNSDAALEPMERVISVKDDDTMAYLLRAAILGAQDEAKP